MTAITREEAFVQEWAMDTASAKPRPTTVKVALAAPPPPSIKIAIVENSSIVGTSLSGNLISRLEGIIPGRFRVDTFPTCEELVASPSFTQGYQLVIVGDIRGSFNGPDCAKQIKQLNPLTIVVGFTFEDHEQAFKDAGANWYALKSIRPDLFVRNLFDLLELF